MVENIVLTNTHTSAVLELDVVTTPYYILDKVDWGQIKGTHHSYKYVNQIGVYVTGTSLETRDVVVNGWIIARTEGQMTDRKRVLNRFVNPQELIELRYKNYVLNFLPDKTIKYSTVIKENNEVLCRFEISGIAPSPLFSDSNKTMVDVASTKPLFHFPLIIDAIDDLGYPTVMFGLREPSLIATVNNKGDVRTGFTLVFKAKGTVVNPSFIFVTTQEFFKLNKTLLADEVVTVNTTIGEKSVVGEFNGVQQNYFRYRDIDSTWLQLEIGDNVFRYDAESGIENLECYVYFSNKYLEVQECY